MEILKDQLRGLDGRVIFEYTIPRMGKRVDVVVLYISFMPENQYVRAAVYFVLITVIFHLLWLAWRLFLRTREKSPAKERITAAN